MNDVYLRVELPDGQAFSCPTSEDVEEGTLCGNRLTGWGVEEAPVVPNLASAILDQVTADLSRLNMRSWHSDYRNSDCGTAHCVAGWAIHLAGKAGYALERELGSEIAGALIWAASTGERVPDFKASNREALEDLRARAALEKAGVAA